MYDKILRFGCKGIVFLLEYFHMHLYMIFIRAHGTNTAHTHKDMPDFNNVMCSSLFLVTFKLADSSHNVTIVSCFNSLLTSLILIVKYDGTV